MEGTVVFFVACSEADATVEVFSLESVHRLYNPDMVVGPDGARHQE
jgi:hypothetical protein